MNGSTQEPARMAEVGELHRRLTEDRVILDLRDPDVLSRLRRDVDRIADCMERGSPTPMLWSGIPFPAAPRDPTSDPTLVISVGGTKTEFALMRLVGGELRLVDAGGRERTGPEIAEAKRALRCPTPTQSETDSGLEMLERIAEPIAKYLAANASWLERTNHIVLSWGFAHAVVRTGPAVLGGLAALTTLMQKEQAAFTRELREKDLGKLLGDALERRLGWSRPVTVANDGVMALHYFLTARNLAAHARFGLFVNGTGTNFAAAEAYAVRPGGVVSRPGETYEPQRITRYRPLRAPEREERFFINYETGSLALDATRTPFDLATEYPIEENALSGGNAFAQQFREILRGRISADLHARLAESWRRANRDEPGPTGPAGPEVSRIATDGPGCVRAVFPGAEIDAADAERIAFVCRAIVNRSALHVALILAAVTARNGFGLGCTSTGKPDFFAAEGSVWSTRGYEDLVRDAWQVLVGPRLLSVDFAREKSYNASLPGPLYFAVIHQ